MFDFICGDNVVGWSHYNQEIICDRFSFEEWHKIVDDIDTDDKWRHFLSEFDDFVKCYILKEIDCNNSIGFVYLYKESISNKIVSIHGGGWGKSMRLSLLYYRGMILMIKYLLKQSYKVRSSCLITNTRAFRFLHSLGFVKYCTTETHHYMWINEKRLKASRIYEYIYR